jgi:hypothetical protein
VRVGTGAEGNAQPSVAVVELAELYKVPPFGLKVME